MKCPNEKCNQRVQPDWKSVLFAKPLTNSSYGLSSSGGIIDSVVKADRVVLDIPELQNYVLTFNTSCPD